MPTIAEIDKLQRKKSELDELENVMPNARQRNRKIVPARENREGVIAAYKY